MGFGPEEGTVKYSLIDLSQLISIRPPRLVYPLLLSDTKPTKHLAARPIRKNVPRPPPLTASKVPQTLYTTVTTAFHLPEHNEDYDPNETC